MIKSDASAFNDTISSPINTLGIYCGDWVMIDKIDRIKLTRGDANTVGTKSAILENQFQVDDSDVGAQTNPSYKNTAIAMIYQYWIPLSETNMKRAI
jgi:hypothetical protein